MKRLLIILSVIFLTSLAAVAKPPHLNVEKLFDGSYNTNKSVSLIVSKKDGKYFRGCSVENNPAMVKKIAGLFEKDLDRAAKSQDIISNGSKFSSMTVINNNLEIHIGLSYDTANGCFLFIDGPVGAFK